MQVTIVTSTTLWDLTVHTHSMPSAFQFQEGVSNYSNSHITFNLNYNCLSQYSIYKKAIRTTHQIDTSQQMEKSAAPGQRVSFTLSLWNLQDRNDGAQWFLEVVFWEIYSKSQFTDTYEVEIFGLAGCMCDTLTIFIMILDSLWPFQALLQSPLRLLGSSDPQCSSPGRRCVCSSHQVRQQFRNLTDTRAYKLQVVQVDRISLELCT